MANSVITFENLIISELRVFPISVVTDELTDENIVKAVTINEELKAIGYCLKPKDVVKLAKSNRINTLYNDIKSNLGDVKAKPMYPNFPSQVMDMDKATFRFHQLVHYFSTYGMESLFGVEVSNGWLPKVEDTEKTEDDVTLLNAKVIELIEETEHYTIFDYAYSKILSKKERITDKDKLIIKECLGVLCVTPEKLVINIPFKQNQMDVFYTIFNNDVIDTDGKINCFKGICKHTGDVWKCIDYVLTKCKYHFTTSQKKLLVKLLESYSIKDFKDNLKITNKKGNRVNLVLQYLSYNKYSRSELHKEAVAMLRNNELSTWRAYVNNLIEVGSVDVYKELAKRPGEAIRMLTTLIRKGFNSADIINALTPEASKLSTQTLVSLCTKFGECVYENNNGNDISESVNEKFQIYRICYVLLAAKFRQIETPLKSKKVYLSLNEYNLDNSKLLTNNKSSEGGYIRSGIAYNIPEDVKSLRFFTYWNDRKRVDIDLHCSAHDMQGMILDFGWNANFADRDAKIVVSGDMTTSNSAEFIDVDISTSKLNNIYFNVNYYNGGVFKDIEECYVGCMAVNNLGTHVKLYNPKNCFFTHYLTGNYKTVNYGYINVPNRYIMFTGEVTRDTYYRKPISNTAFTLQTFINTLCINQEVEIVNTAEEADYTLVMAKPNNDKEISLIDNNFFMDVQ